MSFLLLAGPQAGDRELAKALAARKDAAVVAIIGKDPVRGKRYFAGKLRELLTARLQGEDLQEEVQELRFLADLYTRHLNETYLGAFLTQSLSWTPEQIQRKLRADQQAEKARRLLVRGAGSQAETLLRTCLKTYRALGHTQGITGTLLLLGQVAHRAGRLTEAEKLYRRALEVATGARYRTHVLKALSCLGSLARARGRFEQSVAAYTSYLKWAEEGRDLRAQSRALANLGHVANDRGAFSEALTCFQKALELPGRDRNIEPSVLYGQGRAYHGRRDYLHAWKAYRAALARTKNPRLKVAILDSLGLLWAAQGDRGRALSSFQEALDIEKRAGYRACQVATTSNIARLEAEAENFDRASALYSEARTQARALGDRLTAGRIAGNQAIVALKRGRIEEAEALLREAVALLEQVGDRKGVADLTVQLGSCLLSEGKLREAEAQFSRGYHLQRDVRDYGGIARALVGRAKVALAGGALSEAAKYLSEAMDSVEKQRCLVTCHYFRDIFLSTASLLEPYSLAAEVFVAQGKFSEALRVSERAKAQGLLSDLLARRSSSEVEAKLRQKEAGLRQKAVSLRVRLLSAPRSERADLTAAFDENERAYRSVLEELWAAMPQAVLPRVPQAAELLSFAGAQFPLVLVYQLGERRSRCFVLAGGKVRAAELPPREECEALVNDFRKELRTPAGSCTGIGEKLGEILLGSAEKELAAARSFAVVPDGALHGIPFSALRLRGRYLVETHSVVVWPSVSFVRGQAEAQRRGRREGPARAYVFGNPAYRKEGILDPRLAWGRVALQPLAASKREAEKIAAITAGVLLSGRRASEKNLKEALGKASHLHLAAHGFIHPEDPNLSALFLGGGDGEDGVFELRELGRTRCELVVLSACESALGPLAGGEGFLGFGRAFLQAGARDLVVTLWQVNDESACLLMPAFWEGYWRGKPPAEALRDAQLRYLSAARSGAVRLSGSQRRGGFRTAPRRKLQPHHPFFWAAFVVLGRGSVARGAE